MPAILKRKAALAASLPARRPARKPRASASPALPSIVNVHEAKTQLSRLLARVAAGEEITIARAGQPFARLVPLAAASLPPRVPGRFAGQFRIPDSAFFSPLPAADLDAWESRDPLAPVVPKPAS